MKATVDTLAPLFAPRGIAVVGASADPAKAGHHALRVLDGFPGRLIPVNPRGGRILGREAAKDLSGADGVDLAVLAIPPAAVPGTLAECAEAGVRAAVIVAGGFAEAGQRGAALQQECLRLARAAGIRFLGPNTSGFVNPRAGVFASFVPAATTLRPGPVAVVAHSGGVHHALAFAFHNEGIGLHLGVGLGNAADVGFVDVLDHLAAEGAARSVALHIEGAPDGRALHEAVGRLTERVPVVALVLGRSDVGDFARSHTAALSGGWALTRAALAQAGAVVVDDTTELVDATAALSVRRLAPARSPGVAVVTGQAGPGLLLRDALATRKVAVPELSAATRDRLAALLPPLTYQRNPVDTGRPGPSFARVVDVVSADPAIDAVGVYALEEPDALDPLVLTRLERPPAVYVTAGPRSDVAGWSGRLRAAGIAVTTAPERGAAVLHALVTDATAAFRRAAALTDPAPVPGGARVSLAAGPLDEHAAKMLLETLGVQAPERHVCASREQAHKAARELGMGPKSPVVVKVLDRRVLHKTEVGGVHLGVTDGAALDRALDTITAGRGGNHGPVLVESTAPPGVELLLGARRDPSFGPVVVVGVGGVVAEAVGDVALGLAPLTRPEARALLDRLQAQILLDGFRGLPPVDRDALATAIVAFGAFLIDHPAVSELEVNPLRSTAHGLLALDAMLIRDEAEDDSR